MGDYDVPVKYLLHHILPSKVLNIPKITNKTVELGVRFSPEFVCMPFKYTLGTLIEGLEMGANVLFQAGGGCRYGYYKELQEQILKDMGYEFVFINLVSQGKRNNREIIKKLKEIDPSFSLGKGLYYLMITIKMVKYMDKIDDYIREKIGFEKVKGRFLKLKREMLSSFYECKSVIDLYIKYKYYYSKFKKVELERPLKYLKVGIVGELYTLMEPFSNYNLENKLAEMGISIKRYTNVYYLLFQKSKVEKKFLKYIKEYTKYKMGADATGNIAMVKKMCQEEYDGIIHLKSTFCTPEIGVMPIISKICREYKVPLLFFSFDANTSEVGMNTRLEAFYDMIMGRKR